MSGLILYKNPVPLEVSKHKSLKLNAQANFDFARGVNSLPVAGVEFFRAGRDFPILFLKGADENYVPILLLSLRADDHDLGSDWAQRYVPIYVRRYPFALTEDGLVMIDEDSERLSTETGEALFLEEGEKAETLEYVIKYLRTADAAYRATQEFVEAFAKKDLFMPFSAKVHHESVKIKMDGLYSIDEKKLHEQDESTIYEWFNKGWIAWAHGQLNSVDALTDLARRQHEADSAKVGESA